MLIEKIQRRLRYQNLCDAHTTLIEVHGNLIYRRNQQLHSSAEILWCRTECIGLEEMERTTINIKNCT